MTKEQDRLGLEEIKSLPDAGRLLILVFAAEQIGMPFIDTERLQVSSYLLDRKQILPFSSAFRFDPRPYSEDLSRDLSGLEAAGYLIKHPKVRLTEMGRKWIETKRIDPDLLKEVSDELGRLVPMSDDELLGHSFAIHLSTWPEII